jgi:hypothetical protein
VVALNVGEARQSNVAGFAFVNTPETTLPAPSLK